MCRNVQRMTSTTGIRLSPQLGKRLDSAAKRSGMRKTEIIRAAIAAFLQAHEKPEHLIAGVIQQRTRITEASL
jgi:predicted DNA-binding protein